MKALLLLALSFGLCNGDKNVLFIMADDLRPDLGCYANAHAGFISPVGTENTPNIDKLAADSILFEKAFVQQALCSPSRTSLLTSRRPDTTRVTDITNYFRDIGGNFTTIPQFFKELGYNSIGMGKIFHSGEASGGDNDGYSWTDPDSYTAGRNYYRCGCDTCSHDRLNLATCQSSYALTDAELEAEPHQDYIIADEAIAQLQALAPNALDGTQQFFLAVGFRKPHLPFIYPESYLSQYPTEDISLPSNMYAPAYMPDTAWYSYGELIDDYEDTGYAAYPELDGITEPLLGTENSTYPDAKVIELRQAYYAAISYIDTQVGRVLDELDAQGLTDNTVVAFMGDHGWQLGEHSEWCKNTDFDVATHTPLIIRNPGVTDGGVTTSKLVEFVDIFPTLTQAAASTRLSACTDSNNEELCTEGTSLVPLMYRPNRNDWKEAVFWQHPRGSALAGHVKSCMGYSIRTENYHYTEWVNVILAADGIDYEPDWTDPCDHEELYDISKDPEENYNYYADSDYATIIADLSAKLQAGYTDYQ